MNLSVPSGEGLRVREAEVTDIPGIRDLERRAGAPFREVGLDAVADDEPPTAETLRIAVRKGEVFVVEDTHRREDRGMGRSHGYGSPLLTATSSWSRCPWIPTTGGSASVPLSSKVPWTVAAPRGLRGSS